MIPVVPDALPEPLRDLLARRFSPDPEVASDARYGFTKTIRGLELDADQARAAIRFATDPDLPPPEVEWEDAAADLLTVLWNAPEAVDLAQVQSVYGQAREALRLPLLTLVAATGTRPAARTLVELVEEHGFPDRPYPRFFRELSKLVDHADVLFPSLFERAGEVQIDVGNVLLEALAENKLPDATKRGLAPATVRSLAEALEAAASFQRPSGIGWRFDEEYAPVRSAAGFYLDLAGSLEARDSIPLLRRALELGDPWPRLFACASLLRLGESVDDGVLESIAACHETRAILFQLLEAQGKLGRFPFEHATLESFAAADMVQWLMYPAELGREPEALEKMAAFEVEDDNGDELVLFVWRFIGHDGGWYAAASGVYPKDAPPGPVHGSSTFSRFEPWDSRNAEQHVAAILDNLADWQEHHDD